MEILESETLAAKAVHPYTKMLLASVFDVYCDQKLRKLQLQRESLQVLLKCKRAVLLPGAATGAGRNVKKNCLFCRRLSQDIRLPVFNL